MGKVTELDRTGAGMLRTAEGEALDSMMAVGKAPWHYSKNEDMIALLDSGAKVTSKEVNEVAGLDWQVYQTPAYICLGEGMPHPAGEIKPVLNDLGIVIPAANENLSFKLVGTQREQGGPPEPDYYLNVRDDIHRVIGVVKKRYRIFQNTEAPTFLDNLVDSGEALYETAGSLHGGSQVYWLMRLPESVTIAGDPREKLETYILLTNSHDGSTAIIVAIVTIRVVCQNTLAWSLRNAIRTMKIKHTESAKEKFAEARRTLEIGYAYQAELAEVGEKMLDVSFSNDDLQKFLDTLVPTPKPEIVKGKVTNQRGITMAENTKNGIKTIYFNNETQEHIQGTLWGVVQACSYFGDHMSISRNTESSAEENRFKRLTSGQTIGSEAFVLASKKLALV